MLHKGRGYTPQVTCLHPAKEGFQKCVVKDCKG